MDRTPPPALLRLSVRAADRGIELAADGVLRKCMRALALRDIPLPIPIEQWIEHPLGYELGFADEDELGEGVLGLARPGTGEMLISATLEHHEPRLRFTCAHELAHLLLHKSHAEAFRDVALPHDKTADQVEREADRFAAALLMPVSTLAAQIEAARNNSQLAPECIAMLRGDDALAVWLWRRCFLPWLCDRYGVSRQAMAYRCRELRLPGQRRLLRPTIVPLLVAPERAIEALGLDAITLQNGVPIQST
ncbi:MAG: ImmA/IrrE family metallo-endopeptidase [Phycisphaerales bacterium]